ncbi:MAG: ATP-grasp domain-containing protein [Spirochaetota bacterium]
MSRTILILGAGVMQLPAIRAARRLGLHTIVADGNSDAVGIREADEFLPVDLKDHEGMAAAAEAIRRRRGLDAVFTAGTDFSATVAWVAERLGLPGTPHEAALDATDKFRMRAVLREAGVSVPDFAVVDREEIERGDLGSAASRVGLPVVVKPVDSMGARGVVRADSWEEALGFAREAVGYSRSGRVVVEGYIDGPEFSLDAIVSGDDIQITGFADRHIRFPPYFIEVGHTIPTDLPGPERALVVAEFTRAIRALRLGPGAAKGDIKLSREGVVIGEVANRLSGGYMSGWTYPLSSGVPLSEIGIRVALGEPAPRVADTLRRTSAERAILSIPGTLRDLVGVHEAERSQAVEHVFITRAAGDTLVFPRNNVEKVGNVIAAADSRIEASRAAERAVSLVVARLEPGDRDTARFLFGAAEAGEVLPPEYRHRAFAPAQPVADTDRQTWARLRSAGSRIPVDRVQVPASLVSERGRDWCHRTLSESVNALSRLTGLRVDLVDSPAALDAIDRCVVAALVKGGLQGALYVVDSLAAH